MRILNVIASIDPRQGGPIAALLATVPILAKDGNHSSEIVCLDPPDAPWLGSVPLPVHALGPVPRRYGYTPKLARWLAQVGEHYDVAVIHGLWNHASVGGWQGLRRARLPYVVFAHGMMDPWFRTAYPLKHWAKQAFWLVQGRVLRDAAAVLFTCDEERRLAEGVFRGYGYHSRIATIGIEPPPAEDQANRAHFEAAFPQIAGRRYLLFLSRIHEKKGVDLLVDAYGALLRAAAAPDTLPDLVIAGPDDRGLRPQLEERAAALGVAKRIHWPGMLKGEVKFGAYRGADAFVLPSHQENFGLVVPEALASGIPVLITDKVNIWDRVAACGAGLVRPDTPDGITALLTDWIASSTADRQAMRDAAKPCFLRHFTVEAAARDLEAALEAAVKTTSEQRSVGEAPDVHS